MEDNFSPPETAVADMDPTDRMIRNRAMKSILLNGAAPIAVGLFSWCCNPFLIFTILTVVASVSAFTVPSQMKKRLGEPHLFPEGAAIASYVMGGIGLFLAAGSGVFFFLGTALRAIGN